MMLNLLAPLLVLHLGLALPVQHASDPGRSLQLTVTPALVNRYTAKNMTLRCDQNPKVDSKIAQIFRMRMTKESASEWSLVAEQRDNEDRPRAEGNVTASASVSDVATAFLEVTWDTVGNDSFGVFSCDVIGVDSKYKVIVENTSKFEVREFELPTQYFVGISKETRETVLQLKETTDTEIPRLQRGVEDLVRSVSDLEADQSSTDSRLETLETNQSLILSSLRSAERAAETGLSSVKTLNESGAVMETRVSKVEGFLASLTQWPAGFYGLLQPKTGCPADLAFLGGAHAFHRIHTESQSSSDPSDSYSSALPPHTTSKIGDNNFVSIELCEVKKQFNTAGWPQGSFCIHKQMHQPCPSGFIGGVVEIDMEDSDISQYGRNNIVWTHKINFCCQEGGNPSEPIHLPTGSPFLLYRKGGTCQAVVGMNVSDEYFRLNSEDSRNGDAASGMHPDVDGLRSSIKFHLCYYYT